MKKEDIKISPEKKELHEIFNITKEEFEIIGEDISKVLKTTLDNGSLIGDIIKEVHEKFTPIQLLLGASMHVAHINNIVLDRKLKALEKTKIIIEEITKNMNSSEDKSSGNFDDINKNN